MHKTFGTIIFNTVETFQLEHLILFLVSGFVLFGKKLEKTHAWERMGKNYSNKIWLNMEIRWSIFLRIIHEFQSAIRISSNQFHQFDRYKILKKVQIQQQQIVCAFSITKMKLTWNNFENQLQLWNYMPRWPLNWKCFDT